MGTRHALRRAAAIALGCAGISISAPATADWISLAPSASKPPPKPGELGALEVFGLILLDTGALAAPGYAGYVAFSSRKQPPVAVSATLLGVGGTLGALDAVYLPFVPAGDGPFLYNLTGGLLWGVAGVGAGGLASANPRAPWLGASMGYMSFSLYRAALAFAGLDNYEGSGLAQAIVGGMGAAGCFLDLLADPNKDAEFGIAIGCGVVSTLSAIHGIAWPSRPAPKQHAPRAGMIPTPWFGPGAAGLSLTGVF